MYIRFGPKDRALVGQAMFAISNSLKSSYDEIMIIFEDDNENW